MGAASGSSLGESESITTVSLFSSLFPSPLMLEWHIQERVHAALRKDCPAQFAYNDADAWSDFEGNDVRWNLHYGEGDGIAH